MSTIEKQQEELEKAIKTAEISRKSSKTYYERKKEDPEWMEMQRARQREYNRQWRAKNKENYKEKQLQYYYNKKLRNLIPDEA